MKSLAFALVFLGTLTFAQNADPTAPPATQHPILTLQGRGAQIYRCEAKDRTFQWTFKAPVARLFDAQDREVGTHGDGPTWTYQDSSSISGTAIAKVSTDPASVPALLLQAVGPKRAGLLTTVEYIRRSNTHGGLAPPDGCDAAHGGELARVPYTATYTFYAGK